MKGKISNVSVSGMLRMLCNFGKTGIFNINSDNIAGKVALINGEITDVTTEKTLSPVKDKKHGLVQLLLAVEEGSFYFEDKAMQPKEPLGICVEDAVLESARMLAGEYSGKINIRDLILPDNEMVRLARLIPPKSMTITFTADEWNLLSAFNGDYNIGAAIEGSGMERSRAEIIMYGLMSAGLLRRMRFKIPEVSRIARESMGNIGAAIVDNEFLRQRIDRSRMGMKDFMALLNGLETSFSEIAGRTKAKEIIERIWAATK